MLRLRRLHERVAQPVATTYRTTTQGGASLETFIDQNLAAYAAARQLSKREAEVLRLVLLGKDNQNIATSMHLAPSTVKVHMHHILQKAERANRKELIQDFWEFS